eukprot:PITA_17996
MGDLLKNAPQTGFNTCSYGQNANRIYGLLQCLGNMSQQHCLTCSQLANDSVRQLCGNAIGARVWLVHCFLRYDISTFFSKLDTEGTYLQQRQNNIGTYSLNNLRTNTSRLLSNLSDKACVPANKGFAEYSSINIVYGLVQCRRDISIKDCRTCLQIARNNLYNCCSLKQGADALLGSCRVRYRGYNVLTTSGGVSNTSPPASSGSSNPRKEGSSKTIRTILGILGGVLLALVICLFTTRGKLKSAISRRPVPLAQGEDTHEYGPEWTLNQDQVLFTLEALIESTDSFHERNKLGEGGFGAVYKGNTKDGKEIAVKKLSAISSQGNAEFMNEVKVLANVRHRNLVKLLGCCAEGTESLIVYEYLPNHSLHTLLFDPNHKLKLLDWQTRYKIIMGIACGLRYLHEESEPPIIHRDIKANNILLNEALNPKIADFGLARLFPEEQSHIQTRIAGTFGYLAPEYAMQGQLSMKADVYSFGVLVLEIASGRKVSDIDFPQETQGLLEWAWRLYKEGCLLNMIDPTVTQTCREEQAVRCIHVALLCTQADAGIRPTISNVQQMISSSSEVLPNPKKPAFVRISERIPSTNNVTITELECR